MSRILLYFLLANSFLACTLADSIKFDKCEDSDPSGVCTIREVRITPCKEAGTNKPCSLKKGSPYTIQMDFTADEPIETIKSLPYWASVTDVPFAGMQTDACQFTTCPIAQGANQTYDFGLKLAKSLPRGKFDVKWKFWTQGEEPGKKGCCARFYIKLVS